MKKTGKIIYLLLGAIVYCSCATQLKKTPSVAFEKVNGDTIVCENIPMQKGKICIVYTTSYGNELPSDCVFKKSSQADFTSQNPGQGLLGGRFFSGKSDTTVTSNILVQAAVYEVTRRMLPGMEFVLVNKDDFKDEENQYQTSKLIKQYEPDVVVSLTDLTFLVNGDINIAGITQIHTEGTDTYTIGTDDNYNGSVCIGYQSKWCVDWIEKQISKKIEQRGEIYTPYRKDYSLPQELFVCAKLAGGDFASLLVIE